jgi:thiol-disulfide isomerase/thioredoxin
MKNMNCLLSRRVQIVALAAAMTAGLVWISPRAGAKDPATEPSTQPALTAEAITGDLEKQSKVLHESVSGIDAFTDPVKRAAAAPRAIPCMKKMVADFDALVTADPRHKDEALDAKSEFIIFLSLFGDADATKTLATQAASTDAKTSLEGTRSQLMVSWLSAAKDSKAQTGIVDQIEKLAKANTANTSLTMQMVQMTRMGCSSDDLRTRLQSLVTDTMKNTASDGFKENLAAEKEQEAAEKAATAKLALLENKPLTIAGKQPDGKAFTTDDWKGKVVLVDFWATWCGPCREELPRVSKLYADYHAKGLEILGVSNDFSADDLSKFLGDHKEMPWPQLLDANAAQNQQWNPITTGFGIDGIPTMFLIDKKGVCRTVSARENMEEMIPKLLAEK